jgi:hypothetical protein
MGKSRLLLPPFPQPKEHVSLGRLVLNPAAPHQDYFDPKSVNVSPEVSSSEVENFSRVLQASNNAKLKAFLTDFATTFFESGDKTIERLNACIATEYVLLNSGPWYLRLVQKDEARLFLEQAFNGSSKLYLITGWYTLHEAKIAQSGAKTNNAGMKASAPISQMTGLPTSNVNVGGEGSITSNQSLDTALQAPREKIFAVQYRQVVTKWKYRKDVSKSFLEPDNRWVQLFTTRSQGDDDDEHDILYEASLTNDSEEEIPEGCETLDVGNTRFLCPRQ